MRVRIRRVVQVELDLPDRRLDLRFEAQESDRRLARGRQDLQLRALGPRGGLPGPNPAMTIASASGSVLASAGAISGRKSVPSSGHGQIDRSLADVLAAGQREDELDLVGAGRDRAQEGVGEDLAARRCPR